MTKINYTELGINELLSLPYCNMDIVSSLLKVELAKDNSIEKLEKAENYSFTQKPISFFQDKKKGVKEVNASIKGIILHGDEERPELKDNIKHLAIELRLNHEDKTENFLVCVELNELYLIKLALLLKAENTTPAMMVDKMMKNNLITGVLKDMESFGFDTSQFMIDPDYVTEDQIALSHLCYVKGRSESLLPEFICDILSGIIVKDIDDSKELTLKATKKASFWVALPRNNAFKVLSNALIDCSVNGVEKQQISLVELKEIIQRESQGILGISTDHIHYSEEKTNSSVSFTIDTGKTAIKVKCPTELLSVVIFGINYLCTSSLYSALSSAIPTIKGSITEGVQEDLNRLGLPCGNELFMENDTKDMSEKIMF